MESDLLARHLFSSLRQARFKERVRSENQGTDLAREPLLVLRGAKNSSDSDSALFRLFARLLTGKVVLENDTSLLGKLSAKRDLTWSLM